MKLEGVYSDLVYLTSGRKIFVITDNFELGSIGTLPNLYSGAERFLFSLKTGGLIARLRAHFTGRVHSVNIWPIDGDRLLGNATNWLFQSRDGGQSWQSIKELHHSSGIRGILPEGLCYHEGTIFVGEYIFDESRNPRVFASDDFGQSWRTEIILEGTRHVHAIQQDPFTGDIWIATGDRDSESKIGRLVDGNLEVLGTGSQLWRAVELVFTSEYLFWGTDCPYLDNHVVRIHRDNFGESSEPEIVHSVEGPFYYSTSVEIGNETIILFSTGGGFGSDSTAPGSISQDNSTNQQVGVFGGTSATGFSEWHSLLQYDVKRQLANRVSLDSLAANAYVFLASSPDRGVFVNPINTVTNDGEIMNIPAEELKETNLRSAFDRF